MTKHKFFGVMARFDNPEQLLDAIKAAQQEEFSKLDAYSPFPLPALADALGFHERRISPLSLCCGLLASGGAFFMQWYSAVVSYPYVVGGKPLNSWPAFLPVTFAVGILTAVLVAFLAMLWGNRLPKPYHPVFNWDEFARATDDNFFLLIRDHDTARAKQFLQQLQDKKQVAAVMELLS